MKILFASSSSGSRGGGETYLIYLAQALADRGHEVMLWTSRDPGMDEIAARFAPIGEVCRADYLNTYARRGRSPAAFLDRRTAARAAAEWTSCGAELIHINKQNLEDGLDLLRASRQVSVPTVCTIHITQSARFLGAEQAWLRDFVSRRALRQYRGTLVAVIESRGRELAGFIGDGADVRSIANGVPLFDLEKRDELRARCRAELQIADDEQLVIGVGRMVAQKRPLHFLARAAELSTLAPRARFVWIGDGPLVEEWDREVEAQRLGSVVRRIGWQMDVAPYFAVADLLMHVAEYEGLPLALLEAMSAKLPCAVSENLRAEMPFLTQSNSLAADQLQETAAALQSAAQLQALGTAARQTVEEQFSFDTMARQYEQLYTELLARRS
jgi:glycosyltransferase involved in cell wall biosynthesis